MYVVRPSAKKKVLFKEVSVPASSGIKDGEKITISGVKLKADGSFTRKCQPGAETVLIARVND